MPQSLCSTCSGLCCRYFALPIDNPKTARQYDDIRWYLCHENVSVYIEDKQWYLNISNRCKHLQADNRCGIYETRPQVCRGYSTGNCDYHGGEYNWEKLFTSAEQLDAYAREKLAKQAEKDNERKRRKAGPSELPEPAAPAPRRPRRRAAVKSAPRRLPLLLAVGDPPGDRAKNGRVVPLPLLRG